MADRTVLIGAALESCNTLPMNTELIDRTVGICFARNGFLYGKSAPNDGIAFEWLGTRTDRLVGFGPTNSVLSADAAKQTRISALKAYTTLTVSTSSI